MKFFLCLLFAAGVTLPLSAQIILTRSDAEAWLNEQSFALIVPGLKFEVGDEGTAKVWDFTPYSYTDTTVQRKPVDPVSTAYANEFPRATHAQSLSKMGKSIYGYYRLTDDCLYSLGFAGEISGQTIIEKADPEIPSMKFPATLGMSWMYNGNPSMPLPGLTNQYRFTINIDASGSMKLPDRIVECLLIKQVDYTTSRVEFGGHVISESVNKSVSYIFVGKSGVSAWVDIDTADESSSNPVIESLSYSVQSSTTRIGDPPPEVLSFGVISVYPNPLTSGNSARVTVQVNLPQSDDITLTVHDLTGRLLQTLHRDRMAPGYNIVSFDASALKTGTYILRMTGGQTTSAKVFTVVQ